MTANEMMADVAAGIFIIIAGCTCISMLIDDEPFMVYAWPITAILWCISSIILLAALLA